MTSSYRALARAVGGALMLILCLASVPAGADTEGGGETGGRRVTVRVRSRRGSTPARRPATARKPAPPRRRSSARSTRSTSRGATTRAASRRPARKGSRGRPATPARTAEDIEAVDLPDPDVALHPLSRGVVGAPTWVSLGDPAWTNPDASVEGITARVVVTVSSYDVDWGDGTAEAAPADPTGANAPQFSHTYRRPGRYGVRARIRWSAVYEASDGTRRQLPSLETATALTYPVVEVRGVLRQGSNPAR